MYQTLQDLSSRPKYNKVGIVLSNFKMFTCNKFVREFQQVVPLSTELLIGFRFFFFGGGGGGGGGGNPKSGFQSRNPDFPIKCTLSSLSHL